MLEETPSMGANVTNSVYDVVYDDVSMSKSGGFFSDGLSILSLVA